MRNSAVVGALTTCALIIGFFVGVFLTYDTRVEGSTIEGQEYNATTTAASAVFGSQVNLTNRVIKTGYGSLGSVVITGANTGTLNFYNATTTDITKRTGNTPTSTILIASIPASAAAGTYIFDAVFTTGLMVDLWSGTAPTTTITWR